SQTSSSSRRPTGSRVASSTSARRRCAGWQVRGVQQALAGPDGARRPQVLGAPRSAPILTSVIEYPSLSRDVVRLVPISTTGADFDGQEPLARDVTRPGGQWRRLRPARAGTADSSVDRL